MNTLRHCDIYTAAFKCLSLSDPEEKAKQTRFYAQQWRDGVLERLSKMDPRNHYGRRTSAKTKVNFPA